MADLTGNIRYRRGLFGRLILQLEERHSRPMQFGYVERWTRWRDARVSDLAPEPRILPKPPATLEPAPPLPRSKTV